MRESLTPSNTTSTKKVEKVLDKLRAALRKSDISKEKLQALIELPGTDFEADVINLILKYANKVLGIVTPCSAESLPWIGEHEFLHDSREKEIDLRKIDFGWFPGIDENEKVLLPDLLQRLKIQSNVIGSLGFGAILLDLQRQGKSIIPEELHGENSGEGIILLPRTYWKYMGSIHMGSVVWDIAKRR